MDEAKSQPWYHLYAAAVVELDPKQLIERVDATEAAIHSRLRDLQYDSDHHEERQLKQTEFQWITFRRTLPACARK